MGLRFPEKKYGNCFFITTTFVDWKEFGKIDGVYEGIAKSLSFCLDKYQAKLPAFVLMPSHIHLVLLIEGVALPKFMRDFKKFVSQKIMPDLGIKQNQIWLPRYDCVALYSVEVLKTKINYIHNNPVKAGLATKEEEWPWSSASAYHSNECSDIKVFKDW